jgi:FHA domain
VPAPALRVLEYAFLALLYLFLLRVIRAVWVELREPAPTSTAPETVEAASQPVPEAKLPRRSPIRLVVAGGDGADGQGPLVLGEQLTIGRAPGCGLVLHGDNFVSAHHARVFHQDHQYWVEDLGSTNGTLLNGRRLDAVAPLRKGDRLQVGRTLLELQR